MSGIFVSTSLAAGTGAGTCYAVAPRAGIVKNVYAMVSTATGCESTVSVKDGSTVTGTVVIAAATAAGATTEYTASTTAAYANNVFDAGDVITLAVDARTNSAGITYLIEIDEFGQKLV